ncbi:glycoside hydrolase [Syncephalis pseudoplumigaleata]|uniref:alpha-1,2-Mannosidase n=1 Tax=Syncephalis pseudoplumigaleata TaxID=1712513 RepID=A0A4P9YXQ5_9FUNG|nr:glycoside hydrolase [Syncephalis pseudoplumigaleata]|eukprot:RKP24866.1 glycoside hydrolase [Syncephalis pseudoplumigaleata]
MDAATTAPVKAAASGNAAASVAESPWEQRRQEVVAMLGKCWAAYRRDAFGADVYRPLSHSGQWFGPDRRGIGFTIADSLDTLLLAGLRTEYEQGRDWIARSLSFDVDANVSVFETTIRVLGGLLGGYTLTRDAILLDRARELGDRLLAAYATPSGVPYPMVNLATGKGSYYNGRAEVSLAEVGTLQLEMRELSRLTNEPKYWQAAKRADDVVARMRTLDGLLPAVFPSPSAGASSLGYTMGAMADSYYEYLLKRWLQTGRAESSLRQRYDHAVLGMRKHLVKTSAHSHYVFSGDLEDDGAFTPRMQHLTCFIGATLALGALNDAGNPARASDDMRLAADITDTCVDMYANMPTGLSPELVYMQESSARQVRASNATTTTTAAPNSDMSTVDGATYNILRPETLESLFLMWRATGDAKYRERAWRIFEAFKKHALTPDGSCFTSIADVTKVPVAQMDLMESFLIAETFKYFILIFDDNPSTLPLDRYVLNTEAHPLPIFKA